MKQAYHPEIQSSSLKSSPSPPSGPYPIASFQSVTDYQYSVQQHLQNLKIAPRPPAPPNKTLINPRIPPVPEKPDMGRASPDPFAEKYIAMGFARDDVNRILCRFPNRQDEHQVGSYFSVEINL